jgi:hypothetical protein
MTKSALQWGFAALAALSVVRGAVAAGLAPVMLGPQALAAEQIRTTRLKRLTSAPRISAYGIVLGPGPLVRLASQVIAARGAVAAARAEAALARSEALRATGLYHARHNISQAALQRARSVLEVAEARQATARAELVQWKTRMLARWGPRLCAAALAASAPLPELESGAAALVEVSLPLGQTLGNPPAMALATTPDGGKVPLRFISRAPRVAAGVAGESVFYLMPAEISAPIGTEVIAALTTAPREAGVLVPRSAVVWHQGEPLVFRETAPDSFAPVAVRSSFISGEGYFVPQGAGARLHPGDRIVTGGAALLYSAAMQAAARGQRPTGGQGRSR